MLTQGMKPRCSNDVVFQTMPPDTVLLHLATGYYYSTNRIGAEVWQRCDGKTDIAHLIDGLSKKFDVDRARLTEDIETFLEQMISEGLLLVDGHGEA